MPKMRRLKHKQHGGVKVSFLQPDGSYVAIDVDIRIINAIFENCMDMYLISASSASGIVIGSTLPDTPLPRIRLRANQLNEDGTFRTQDQVANRQRFVNEGLIVTECCLKISFVEPLSGPAKVTVGGHVKRTCNQADLNKEVAVQDEMFRSAICGDTPPLTFTPDKIAATTMSPTGFSAIVEALATRTPTNPPRAIATLREIQDKAKKRGLHIHIFVMELLRGETLRTILEKPIVSVSQQQKRNACNNVAVAVIMTFLKSLYWSRDEHADNVMIFGAHTFTLDFGLMYHLIRDEIYIKSLLESLLNSTSIHLWYVCTYFCVTVTDPGGTTITKVAAKAEVRRIFNELYDMLRNPNLKELMKIDPAAAMVAEINRISGIVFQMLSFFLLVDGLSNIYRHGTHHFQSREYMELVFTKQVLYSFQDFIQECRITLSAAFAGNASVQQNMAYIVQGLQPALALCQGRGPPRDSRLVRLAAESLGPFSTSPGQIDHDAKIQRLAEEEARTRQEARLLSEAAAAAAAVEAIRMKELAVATSTKKSGRPRSRSREAQPDEGTVTVLDILSPEDEDDMSTYEKYTRYNKHRFRLKNLKPEEIKKFKDLQDRKTKLYAEDRREEIEDEIRQINSKQHDLVTERELGKGGKSRKSSKSSKSSKSRKSRKSRKYSRN